MHPLQVPVQHPGFRPVRDLIAVAVPGKQPSQSVGREAPALATYIAVATIELGANLGPSEAVGEHENQPCMPRCIRSSVSLTGFPL